MAKPVATRYAPVYAGDDFEVRQTLPGITPSTSQLHCTCTIFRTSPVQNVAWCPHLATVYEKNLDVYQEDIDDPVELPPFVEVVIFKSKPAALAGVGLDPVNDIGLQRAWLIVNNFNEGAFSQHYIGFLSPGCGRMVLRRMVLDELTGLDEETVLSFQCLNPAHWKTVIMHGWNPKDKLHLADTLYRLQYSECWYCYNNSSVPDIG